MIWPFRPKPPYTVDELTAYMAQAQSLQAQADKNATLYRQSQVKQLDGSYGRDERYKLLADQDMANLVVAKRVLGKMLQKSDKYWHKKSPPVTES